jgi:hypothetical protein
VSDENMPIAFKMIASPRYKCECITLDKAKGVAKLKEALQIIETAIKERKGTYKLINEPIVISAKNNRNIDEITKLEEDVLSYGAEDNQESVGDIDSGDEDGEYRK